MSGIRRLEDLGASALHWGEIFALLVDGVGAGAVAARLIDHCRDKTGEKGSIKCP